MPLATRAGRAAAREDFDLLSREPCEDYFGLRVFLERRRGLRSVGVKILIGRFSMMFPLTLSRSPDLSGIADVLLLERGAGQMSATLSVPVVSTNDTRIPIVKR